MKTRTLHNPFVVGKYVSDQYFCDRETETEFLVKQVINGRNTALISPRRMGKTGLILHTFNQKKIKENYHTFFIDIYSTSSLAELAFIMGKTIFNELKSKKTIWKERFFQIIKSFRIGFNIDPHTGEPGLNIRLGDIKQPETTLDEIFSYLETSDKPCIVAIDEFQQIGEYKENNVEALLRTKIQQCKQTSFIFAGSKRHLMNNMFNSVAKPFYQSAISMSLEPIQMDIYVDFSKNLFALYNKKINNQVIERVYKRFEGCTWFIQLMMNELFALTNNEEECDVDKLPIAWNNIIQIQRINYLSTLSLLSPKQKMLLQAISKEGKARNITSAEFIQRHRLPSASSVQAALKGLIKYDIVTQDGDGYRIYDYYFSEWLKKNF